LIGLNVLVAGYLCFKKRWREAFQAFVLPFLFWFTFMIAYAITDGTYGPFSSSSKTMLARLGVGIAVWGFWFTFIRALPWPPVPLDELTDQELAAFTRRARVTGLLFLAYCLWVAGFGAYLVAGGVSFAAAFWDAVPAILAIPIFIAIFAMGGFILYGGVVASLVSWGYYTSQDYKRRQ
jgi:hypothetical protein